ncbi:MAG: PEGA domain-containing protein [Methanomicrobiales archaeon]|nr:PEGA domain-containing protein [Methanomicrobiales archaeon]
MTHERTRPIVSCILLCILLTVVIPGNAAAEPREAEIGDSIPLSGTSIGAGRVYLFMTGPGVPSDGSRMDSSISPVITGEPETFTQVDVTLDRWNYTWRTGRVSGGLAAGKYTVYAATMPVARDALSGVPYSSIDIILSRPVTNGRIEVLSTPPGAQVTVNGQYSGNTPLDLPDLLPGTYQVLIELRGYLPAENTVDLAAGDTVRVDVVLLSAETPAPAETSPTETAIPDTAATGTPTAVPISPAAPLCGILLTAMLMILKNGR